MWGGAGVVAFGVGGAIALLTARKPVEPVNEVAPQPSAQPAPIAPAPAPAETTTAAPSSEPSAAPAASADATAAQTPPGGEQHVPKTAISASELPIEKKAPK